MSDLLPIEHSVAEMKFTAVAVGSDVTITLTGTADARSHEELRNLLNQSSEACADLGTKAVTVDITSLEFMNSSSFKQFVSWIVQIHKLPAHKQYSLEFQSNPDFHWQARSLGALTALGRGLVKVKS